jgi:hypothetical protein
VVHGFAIGGGWAAVYDQPVAIHPKNLPDRVGFRRGENFSGSTQFRRLIGQV